MVAQCKDSVEEVADHEMGSSSVVAGHSRFSRQGKRYFPLWIVTTSQAGTCSNVADLAVCDVTLTLRMRSL